jgi:hypothetical protein
MYFNTIDNMVKRQDFNNDDIFKIMDDVFRELILLTQTALVEKRIKEKGSGFVVTDAIRRKYMRDELPLVQLKLFMDTIRVLERINPMFTLNGVYTRAFAILIETMNFDQRAPRFPISQLDDYILQEKMYDYKDIPPLPERTSSSSSSSSSASSFPFPSLPPVAAPASSTAPSLSFPSLSITNPSFSLPPPPAPSPAPAPQPMKFPSFSLQIPSAASMTKKERETEQSQSEEDRKKVKLETDTITGGSKKRRTKINKRRKSRTTRKTRRTRRAKRTRKNK